MTEQILIDTGPLVAILSPNDPYHRQCSNELRKLPRTQPLLTCWPVITEAAWLLRNQHRGLTRLLQVVDGTRVRILSLGDAAAGVIAQFVAKYESLSPQLADAALVYLAERERIGTVFTIDNRHFSIYRLGNGKALRLLPEQ